MKRLFAAALLATLTVWPFHAAQAQDAGAATSASRIYRVDDSGTFVLDPSLKMEWQPIGRGRPSNVVSATTKVSVQLNLANWMGRSGRIFMALPRTTGTTVRASWTTGGIMLPGSLISGDRALVYSGPVTAMVLRDLLDIKLEADGSRLAEPEALAFGFEIEVDQ